jgi:hypothetical protein
VLVALSSLLAVAAGRSLEVTPVRQATLPTVTPTGTQVDQANATRFETDNLGGRFAGIQEAQPAPQLPRPGAVSERQQPAFTLQEIVRLKQFNIDVEYYDAMTVLFGDLDVDDLVALKIHDVDAEYVAEMSKLFEDDLAFEEIVRLSQQGVQSRDLQQLLDQGVDLDVKVAIDLQRMGVDPDELQQLMELQMPNTSMDDLVQLARLGLDADDVAELQEELGSLTVPQCIALLTNGVDAHDIEELREMGMQDPDPETLVHMYTMGLSADVIDVILDDEMEEVPVEALVLFKELGLEEIFLDEFRRRNR